MLIAIQKQTKLRFLSLFETLDKCWAISIQNENEFVNRQSNMAELWTKKWKWQSILRYILGFWSCKILMRLFLGFGFKGDDIYTWGAYKCVYIRYTLDFLLSQNFLKYDQSFILNVGLFWLSYELDIFFLFWIRTHHDLFWHVWKLLNFFKIRA